MEPRYNQENFYMNDSSDAVDSFDGSCWNARIRFSVTAHITPAVPHLVSKNCALYVKKMTHRTGWHRGSDGRNTGGLRTYATGKTLVGPYPIATRQKGAMVSGTGKNGESLGGMNAFSNNSITLWHKLNILWSGVNTWWSGVNTCAGRPPQKPMAYRLRNLVAINKNEYVPVQSSLTKRRFFYAAILDCVDE